MGEAPDPYPLLVEWCDRCDTAQVRVHDRDRCVWCGDMLPDVKYAQPVAPKWWYDETEEES